MKIKSLQITNFRGFNGEHFIEFSTDPDKPVTLIVAENGTGKSNVLEAIMWCFHGTLPPKKNKDEQTICMDSRLNNARAQAKVKMTVIDDKDSQKTQKNSPEYTISRTLKENEGESELAVWEKDEGRQGGRVPIDTPLNLIEQLLPKSLSPYFLYSGEGINNLFEDKDEAGLKASIEHMQGLSFATKALDYLKEHVAFLATKLTREENASKAEKKALEDLEEINKDYNFYKDKNDKALKSQKDLKKRINEINEVIGKSDHELVKIKTNENVTLAKQIFADIKDKERHIFNKRSLMGQSGFQVLSFDLKSSLTKFVYKNKKEGNIPAKVHQQTLTNVLDNGECICGEKLDEKRIKFINESFDDAGTDDQSNHYAVMDALLKTFNLSNRLARVQYEENELLIIEKEDNISRNQNQVKINNATIKDSEKDKNIEELLEEKAKLEKDLEGKIYDDLFDSSMNLKRLEDERKKKIKLVTGGGGVDPVIKKRMDFIEECSKKLESEIEELRISGRIELEKKLQEISKKYNKKNEVIFYKNDESYIPVLKDSKGLARPQNDASISQTAIYYTLGLVHVCKERFKNDKLILKPGTIAPIIFDSPFSKLDPGNIGSVTKMIGEIPEQSVLIVNSGSYEGDCRKVLKQDKKIGKAYYFQRKQLEDAPPDLETMKIGSKIYKAFIKSNDTSNTIHPLKDF